MRGSLVVFSDVASFLRKVEEYCGRGPRIVLDILRWCAKIISLGFKIHLQWIPSHVGVPGNEIADKLAVMGAKLPQLDDWPVALFEANAKFKAFVKGRWAERWREHRLGRQVYQECKHSGKNREWQKLSP